LARAAEFDSFCHTRPIAAEFVLAVDIDPRESRAGRGRGVPDAGSCPTTVGACETAGDGSPNARRSGR